MQKIQQLKELVLSNKECYRAYLLLTEANRFEIVSPLRVAIGMGWTKHSKGRKWQMNIRYRHFVGLQSQHVPSIS